MKIRRTIALASAAILAAGCAHQQHQAQYDESFAPTAANQSSQYNSSQNTSGQNVAAVGTTSMPNDALVNQVRQSLQQDPQTAPVVQNIQITADKGMVVLSGTVQTREQKRKIQSIVAGDPGVDILDDQLRLSSSAMNPTSNNTNSSPIYHDAGNVNNSTNNASNQTSRTNGPSQIYQDQNSQGVNTNGNNKIP